MIAASSNSNHLTDVLDQASRIRYRDQIRCNSYNGDEPELPQMSLPFHYADPSATESFVVAFLLSKDADDRPWIHPT